MDNTNTLAVNDLIGVEPFPKAEAPTQVTKSGFTRDTRKGTLVGLKVMFGTFEYPVGSIVWVKSDNTVQPWAKEVFEINGQSLIFMPKSFVILREYTLFVAPSVASTWIANNPYAAPSMPVGENYEIGTDGVLRKKP